MADLSSIGDISKAIGNPIGTFFAWMAEFFPEGPLRTLFIVAVGLCSAVVLVPYRYYLGLLAKGGAPDGPIERQD